MNAFRTMPQREKQHYCDLLTENLVELRSRLGKTQEELEKASGISRVTLSQIESHRAHMSWLHFAALMQLFTQNQETKELLFVRGILDAKLLSVYQRKQGEAPEYNTDIPEESVYLLRLMREDEGLAEAE